MHSVSTERKIFYSFFALVLTIHAGMLSLHYKDQIAKTSFVQEKSIKLKLIQEAMKELALSDTKRQIVQSEDSELKEKPTTKAFLSDKDRKFERETMARSIDTFKKAALGDSAVSQVAQKESSAKKKAFKDLKLSDFGMMAGDPLPKEVKRAPASAAVKGIKTGDPLSQGLSATNDYVEEVKLGDFTHLNTVEYKFYGFYHRIRQKLEQFWGKSIQEKAANIFRAGRRLPASENLITSVQITLNADGEITSVKITGASGVKELDDAAVESFNQAGPFPNPPKELLVNGKATIDWGFVVKS